jgi:hypothetical protein
VIGVVVALFPEIAEAQAAFGQQQVFELVIRRHAVNDHGRVGLQAQQFAFKGLASPAQRGLDFGDGLNGQPGRDCCLRRASPAALAKPPVSSGIVRINGLCERFIVVSLCFMQAFS